MSALIKQLARGRDTHEGQFSAYFMNGESPATLFLMVCSATSSFPFPPHQSLWENSRLQNREQEQTLDMHMLEEYTVKPVTTSPVLPSNSTSSIHLHVNIREGTLLPTTHILSLFSGLSHPPTLSFSLQFPHSVSLCFQLVSYTSVHC